MSALFKTPKIPKPEAPPPIPTVDDAALRRNEQLRLRKRRGRAATLMSGVAGDPSTPNVSAAHLLGG